jgi:glycosyltransferase involved in cell wall biosynthesis
MHLGLDASRATVARRTGTESYALHLIRALLSQASSHAVTLYFRDPPKPDLFPAPPGGRVTQRVIPFPRLWTHLRLAWDLWAARPRPDVLFIPAHVVPLICPVPAVVTVHDLGYRFFPDAHPLRQRLYLDFSTRFSAWAAAHVLADSEATRRDLIRMDRVPAEKITVVYPGRDEAVRRADPAPVRAQHRLPERYLLHVGTLQPRKNLLRLIDAHAALQTDFPDLHLVLAGRPGWLSAPIVAAALARPERVHLLAYVPDESLAGLYSGAAAFVFPSLYEGFGLPVLEAMACEVPVVCSNTSSLPEVAGEAAMSVDPLDTGALAAAIRRVLLDPSLRSTLVARGLDQITSFTWDRAARETLAILERVGASS